jgi:hypothetical protein
MQIKTRGIKFFPSEFECPKCKSILILELRDLYDVQTEFDMTTIANAKCILCGTELKVIY